jgi:hypothetical protein
MGEERIENGRVGVGARIPRGGRDVADPRHSLDTMLKFAAHCSRVGFARLDNRCRQRLKVMGRGGNSASCRGCLLIEWGGRDAPLDHRLGRRIGRCRQCAGNGTARQGR